MFDWRAAAPMWHVKVGDCISHFTHEAQALEFARRQLAFAEQVGWAPEVVVFPESEWHRHVKEAS